MNIQIQCDRCGKLIDGIKDYYPEKDITITGGFYVVSEGIWQTCQRWEEENICDDCMHSDPKYIKTHGNGVVSGSVA